MHRRGENVSKNDEDRSRKTTIHFYLTVSIRKTNDPSLRVKILLRHDEDVLIELANQRVSCGLALE